jgi:5-methylcytosine-specific restriction endonuclease McrA
MASAAEAAEAAAAFWAALEARRPKGKPTRDVKAAFYKSQAWQRLRYAALRANREKHGQITCEVCGDRNGPFHGDHIVPLSKDWSRRLDPTNVQIACQACNMGKSNTDAIDWRSGDG